MIKKKSKTKLKMLTLDHLLKMQEEKKKQEIQLYKVVLTDVENQINIYAKNDKVAFLYQIPSFIFGYPIIDVPKTMEYIIGVLNHKGFIAIQVNPNVIYISWELTSVLRNKYIKDQKRIKNDLINVEAKRESELTETLVQNKLQYK